MKQGIVHSIVKVLFLGLSIAPAGLLAQQLTPEVLSTAGHAFEQDGYTLQWTLGEVAILTFQKAESILSQGFHQTGEYFDVGFSGPLPMEQLILYPNPATERVYLKVDPEYSSLNLEIFHSSGTLVEKCSLYGEFPYVDLGQLPPGSYLFVFSNLDGSRISRIPVIRL